MSGKKKPVEVEKVSFSSKRTRHQSDSDWCLVRERGNAKKQGRSLSIYIHAEKAGEILDLHVHVYAHVNLSWSQLRFTLPLTPGVAAGLEDCISSSRISNDIIWRLSRLRGASPGVGIENLEQTGCVTSTDRR